MPAASKTSKNDMSEQNAEFFLFENTTSHNIPFCHRISTVFLRVSTPILRVI